MLLQSVTEKKLLTTNDVNIRLKKIYTGLFILSSMSLIGFIIVTIILRSYYKRIILTNTANVFSTVWTLICALSLFYSQYLVVKASKLMKAGIINVKGFIMTIGLLILLVIVQIVYLISLPFDSELFYITEGVRDYLYFFIMLAVFITVDGYTSSMNVVPVLNEKGETCFYCYDGTSQKVLF